MPRLMDINHALDAVSFVAFSLSVGQFQLLPSHEVWMDDVAGIVSVRHFVATAPSDEGLYKLKVFPVAHLSFLRCYGTATLPDCCSLTVKELSSKTSTAP